MDKNYILDKLKENRETLEGYGVIDIGLFGSYVTGTATEESDIDILVKMEDTGKMYFRMGRLQYFLESTFNKKIDLIRITEDEPIYKSKDSKEHFQKVRKEIMESVVYV